MFSTSLPLYKDMFVSMERRVVDFGALTASSFLYPSGVQGLKVSNGPLELVILPFQGQQIWNFKVNGRDITQKTMFTEPNPNRVYLETYGGFLLHCGASAMGVPGPQDTHPLHGHLPNAPFQKAWLELGMDDEGAFLIVKGSYTYTMAFNLNYEAVTSIRIRENKLLIDVRAEITNLKNTDMPFMYLAHVNFRPVNGSILKYSALCDPRHVRVRTSIPSHVHPPEGFKEFLDELSRDPSRHNAIQSDLAYDPEVAFYIDYLHDEAGWAHTMQVLPDGSADYIAHRPEQLPKGVRWICRTPDQDALGMVLPATAEPEGFTEEQKKGNVLTLKAHQTYTIDLRVGVLSGKEAGEITEKISAILEQER